MSKLAKALREAPPPVDPRKGGQLDRLDDEDQQAVIALYAEHGYSGEQIAKLLEQHGIELRGNAVRVWLHKKGVM